MAYRRSFVCSSILTRVTELRMCMVYTYLHQIEQRRFSKCVSDTGSQLFSKSSVTALCPSETDRTTWIPQHDALSKEKTRLVQEQFADPHYLTHSISVSTRQTGRSRNNTHTRVHSSPLASVWDGLVRKVGSSLRYL